MSMIPHYNQLVQAIFRTDKPDEIDVESIEQLSNQFPYYAPVQYLLSRKIKKTNPQQYRAQIAKTAIFFNNPHWLNNLLIKEDQEDLAETAIPEIEEAEADSAIPNGDTDITSDENLLIAEEPEELPETAIPEIGEAEADSALPDGGTDTKSGENLLQEPSNAPDVVNANLDDKGDLPLVPIEPLFAVDYFASQGIQLAEGEHKDKLSQKLRSFTEWLKTMKKIHPEKLEQEMDEKASSSIQHIAEISNTSDEIITETMAEVYARQGLRNKAAEVYQKLSLLNPDKRTYFAAKISKLNDV